MAFTPIPIGSLSWGSPVNSALGSQDARITDLEQGGGAQSGPLNLLSMTYDPALAIGGNVLTAGTVYMMRFDIMAPATISLGVFNVFIAGAGLTAAQNWVGLYNAAGTRVALSADQTTAWASVGLKDTAFTAPYAAAAGSYYLAILSNGTTPPQLLRTIASLAVATTINRGLPPETARWTTGPTAQTTLPTTITMSARTLSGTPFWTGIA